MEIAAMNPEQNLSPALVLGPIADRILDPRMPVGSSAIAMWVGPGRLLLSCDRSILEIFLTVAGLETLDHQAKQLGLVEVGAIEENSGDLFQLFPIPGINGNPDNS